MRAQKQQCTVTRPRVDHAWLPNVRQVRLTDSKDSDGYRFYDWYDVDTGVVVYTTPQRPDWKSAMERAQNWRRRRGFRAYSALNGGGYIKVNGGAA